MKEYTKTECYVIEYALEHGEINTAIEVARSYSGRIRETLEDSRDDFSKAIKSLQEKNILTKEKPYKLIGKFDEFREIWKDPLFQASLGGFKQTTGEESMVNKLLNDKGFQDMIKFMFDFTKNMDESAKYQERTPERKKEAEEEFDKFMKKNKEFNKKHNM